jgi:hypothetical protein
MKAPLLVAAAAVLFAAAPVLADDIAEMQSALQDLHSAHGHMKAAGHDYGGHRKQAMDLVERAIAQVNEGIKVGDRKDAKDEKKAQQLDNKAKRLENKAQQLKQ